MIIEIAYHAIWNTISLMADVQEVLFVLFESYSESYYNQLYRIGGSVHNFADTH